jgi:hypothetical protein
LLLLTGCATGTPVGFKLASGDFRHRRMVPVELRKEAPPPGTVVRSERTGTPGMGALSRYKAFIQGQRETLSRRPEEERRLGEAVLRELEWWLWQQQEAQLARQHPLEVYLRLLEARQAAERKEAARWAAVEEKLEEYWRWAEGISLLMPPPGSKAQGFIPDAVPGNPNPGELVWGQPYRFVEAKARAELALTGNLKAMLEYIVEHGGHIELWVRSARHSAGPTRLTRPLQEKLADLERSGSARVRYHP